MPPKIDSSLLKMFAGGALFVLSMTMLLTSQNAETVEKIMMLLAGFLVGGNMPE